MKRFFALLFGMVAILIPIALCQVNPSYQQFNTNQFYTNSSPWKIALVSNLPVINLTVLSNSYFGSNIIVTNVATFGTNVIFNKDIYISNSIIVQGNALDPKTLWLPTLQYELWYDPFQGRDLGNAAIGMMGWTFVNSASMVINVSNAVNHFGTVALTTSATSNAGGFIHLSSTPVTKPCIPPLNSFAGWTNRIVWRLNGTNAVRAYLVFTAGTFTSTLEMTNAMGIAILSTTNANIMGYCSGAAANSTTNLNGGTLVSGQWYTNYMWCASPGVISFSINGGPEATLNSNIPIVGLTPNIGFRKFAASVSSLEVDDWMLVVKRQ